MMKRETGDNVTMVEAEQWLKKVHLEFEAYQKTHPWVMPILLGHATDWFNSTGGMHRACDVACRRWQSALTFVERHFAMPRYVSTMYVVELSARDARLRPLFNLDAAQAHTGRPVPEVAAT